MNENDIDEFEQCFLGSLLLANPKELPQLKVKPHYFSNSKNGRIFQAYQKQIAANVVPDIRTLCFDPDLADIGKDYMASLNSKIPSAANLQFYESKIINAWQLRICNFGNEKFQEKLKTAKLTGEIDQVIIEYHDILSGALCDNAKNETTITFSDYISHRANKEYWREYTPPLFGKLPFPDGTISAIGAAPGGGKTALMLNHVRELLTTLPTDNRRPGEREKAQNIDAERKILFISAEMSAPDLTDRLVHSLAWQTAGAGEPYYLESVEHTNKDYWKALKYKYGTPPDHWEYSQQELRRVELYSHVLEKYIKPAWGNRLKIAYVRGRKCFDDIYHIILNNAEPGTLVLMDYLQLMPVCNSDIGQGNPRYLEIRHVMDMCIIAAEITQSVIIAAAQLGREERRGGNKGDDTQGWRESGDIEQTAWNLIKLTREKEKLSFKITKARNSVGVDTPITWTGYPHINTLQTAGNCKPREKP